jgi:ubiquinol oxidase
LKDVVKVVRDDEAGHRDVNHSFARLLNEKLIKKNQSSDKKEGSTLRFK